MHLECFDCLRPPEPKPFTGTMKDAAVETLRAAGHEVVVSDLYAMGFSPSASDRDFEGERANPEFLSYATEQTKTFETKTQTADIVIEQERLGRSHLIIFQFPVRWFGMPAMLKGWAERVFARGYAYMPGRKFYIGMFEGKFATVATTTGNSADTHAPDGSDGDILTVLWPIHNGLLRYSGFDALPSFVAYVPGRVGQVGREGYLEAYKKRLFDIEKTLAAVFPSGQ